MAEVFIPFLGGFGGFINLLEFKYPASPVVGNFGVVGVAVFVPGILTLGTAALVLGAGAFAIIVLLIDLIYHWYHRSHGYQLRHLSQL